MPEEDQVIFQVVPIVGRLEDVPFEDQLIYKLEKKWEEYMMTNISALLDAERIAHRADQRRLNKACHDRDRYARRIKQLQRENDELKKTIYKLSRAAASQNGGKTNE